MSAFLSGADCGPGNALKTVSGRLERDVSIHHVWPVMSKGRDETDSGVGSLGIDA
jgi:hypothetical protein